MKEAPLKESKKYVQIEMCTSKITFSTYYDIEVVINCDSMSKKRLLVGIEGLHAGSPGPLQSRTNLLLGQSLHFSMEIHTNTQCPFNINFTE